MRKAKIICTIGPASCTKKVVGQLISSGMNAARLNLSHGTHAEHRKAIDIIRSCAAKKGSPVAILLDLKGLKIRVGSLNNGSVHLKNGSTVALTSRNIKGDNKLIPILYNRLARDLKPGDNVFIDDGLLQLKILHNKENGLMAKVIEGGLLKERKGVNLPGVSISAPTLTKKDIEDIGFGVEAGVDYIAVSFVTTKMDISRVKHLLKKMGSDIPVIAKIETRQALHNIHEIINVSDGIMIARGDLGVEVPPEEVPIIQKQLIDNCNRSGKPVITATQMLESMTEHLNPTRAEAADVANAVIDGTDALMLSAETAAGKYPVRSLIMMDKIIRYTEEHRSEFVPVVEHSESFAHAIAEAACTAAVDVGAKVIVAFSRSGYTSLLVSKFRTHIPIIGFTVKEEVRRRMNLYHGIRPFKMNFPRSTDEMISESEKRLLEKGIVKKGDSIVIIATSPFAFGEKTNIMKLHMVGL
ncbi:MAG: pyruvate kinase [Thermodesulfovibrionia bacterium]|nr:pyruvate kinase [Thermodesulfovibrionia bacterium]